MTQLQPGDIAPDITLPLDNGGSFRLHAQRGHPVVLYFYPADDTASCTVENHEFSERAAQFAALGARLVGISPDSIAKHVKFRGKHDLQAPLAADPEHHAIAAFDLWQPKKLYGREFMGLIRTSFIIAADGVIVAIIPATRIRGHAQKVLAALQDHLAGLR
ncbi:MAG: peroxiredoxin [Candidatus Devosia euplotis]|nr:peroxiredoxin [Candidatus Devosia euplotis]